MMIPDDFAVELFGGRRALTRRVSSTIHPTDGQSGVESALPRDDWWHVGSCALRAISRTHQNEVAFRRLRTLNVGGTGRLGRE